MCSPMERDCRRRIELDLECDDVNAVIDKMVARRDALFSELQAVESRIAAAISSSGKSGAAIPVRVAGRDWTISYLYGEGVRSQEVISPDSPLFAQPPVADAVADSPSDDDIDAVLDPKGDLAVEIEREARRSREAIIRDGVAAIPPELDPVAGLGSLLRETRYGEPRIPTIRDGKSVGALEALASIRSALRSDDPIAEAAVYAAMEDDGGFPLPGYSGDETVVPDEDHAVVEHQAAS